MGAFGVRGSPCWPGVTFRRCPRRRARKSYQPATAAHAATTPPRALRTMTIAHSSLIRRISRLAVLARLLYLRVRLPGLEDRKVADGELVVLDFLLEDHGDAVDDGHRLLGVAGGGRAVAGAAQGPVGQAVHDPAHDGHPAGAGGP